MVQNKKGAQKNERSFRVDYVDMFRVVVAHFGVQEFKKQIHAGQERCIHHRHYHRIRGRHCRKNRQQTIHLRICTVLVKPYRGQF